MVQVPSFEFHVSRAARDAYDFDQSLFTFSGNVIVGDMAACRAFAERMNKVRDTHSHPERAVHPGALNAMGLIDEVSHLVVALYQRQRDARALLDALAWFENRLGRAELDRTLLRFADEFPTVAVYQGKLSAAQWLAGSTGEVPHRAVALEELMLLWLANLKPAFKPFHELFADQGLSA